MIGGGLPVNLSRNWELNGDVPLVSDVSLFDDENERCNDSSQPIQRNVFSQFIPPSTICSTVNAI